MESQNANIYIIIVNIVVTLLSLIKKILSISNVGEDVLLKTKLKLKELLKKLLKIKNRWLIYLVLGDLKKEINVIINLKF
jgi:hypothetical protein